MSYRASPRRHKGVPMSEVKEHPIIFSGEMVRAILEGRKTMTRRVVKPQLPDDARLLQFHDAAYPVAAFRNKVSWFVSAAGDLWPCNREDVIECPYGTVGDKLRVTENLPPHVHFITLEITAIYVDRLQNISEEDAIKEGSIVTKWYHANGDYTYDTSAKNNFSAIWESLDLRRNFGWDANPWVWVIEFRRVEV